jgi:hypothetical protein
MATISTDNDSITVRMKGAERFGTFHTAVTVRRDQITTARVVDEPFAELRGIRAPGFGWPRTVAIGRWRHRSGKDLVVLRRGDRAILIDLNDGAQYRRLLIGHTNPEGVVSRLT